MYTGSRRYSADSTLVDRLPSSMITIARANLFDPAADRIVWTILAALILCLWPLPMTSMWKDPCLSFSGAAIQLALQSGLHHVSSPQDYARTPLKLDDNARLFRARLWAYCSIVFQRYVSIRTCHFPCTNFDQHQHMPRPPFHYVPRFSLPLHNFRSPTSALTISYVQIRSPPSPHRRRRLHPTYGRHEIRKCGRSP